MDVLLINPPYPRRAGGSAVEPIGLYSLAASLLLDNHDVRVLDLAGMFPRWPLDADALEPLLRRNLDKYPLANLIGVGPLVTASLASTRAILQTARALTNAHLVVGGPLCSAPNFDAVALGYLDTDSWVVGDGEDALAAIARNLQTGIQVRGLAGVGTRLGDCPLPQRISDLDRLPIPARLPRHTTTPSARRAIGQRRTTAAFLSRGCPYSCTFCAAPLVSGRKVRRFSPQRITMEIQACQSLGYDDIIFYDDCLFVRGSRLDERVKEFAAALRNAEWTGTFQLELRCDAVLAMSDDALKSLLGAGLRQVNMGIEKGHVASLNQMRKRLAPDVARRAANRLFESGTRAAGTFILGGEGEALEDLNATIDFAESLPLTFAHFNPLAIYPGTQLYRNIFGDETNWLALCLDETWAPRGDILWRSSQVSIDEIGAAVHAAYARFYSQERLRQYLTTVPDGERDALKASYTVLSTQRAGSLLPAVWEECL